MEESIETKVKKALESIRPFLNNDGGDIELVEIKDNKVYVRLLGNCKTACPKHRKCGKYRMIFLGQYLLGLRQKKP